MKAIVFAFCKGDGDSGMKNVASKGSASILQKLIFGMDYSPRYKKLCKYFILYTAQGVLGNLSLLSYTAFVGPYPTYKQTDARLIITGMHRACTHY